MYKKGKIINKYIGKKKHQSQSKNCPLRKEG